MNKDTTVRPWLAAVLTLIVAGLGHLYIRQWFRAVGWFTLVVLAGVLFVPESVVEAPATADIEDVTPLLFVALLAVIDAYLQARQHNRRVAINDGDRCPHCRRVTDPELSFCQWCTTPRPVAEELGGADPPRSD